METAAFNNSEVALFEEQLQSPVISTDKPFIQANTIESSLQEIKMKHVIPVFTRDNEPVISHADFIESAIDVVSATYQEETLLKPSIRLSHPIKGRIPEAKDKPANALQEHEKTLYYERMAFIVEIPTIHDEIDGNRLSLTIGGVKAYNLDNLYARKGADEHFKIFIGFQNKVCTNLCVWTDGYLNDLKVKSLGQLKACIRTMVEGYNANYHIHALRALTNYGLTEQQFALLIGRCRMYNHLPVNMKNEIIPLQLSDTQLGAVAKDYYRDNSFCRMEDGSINLWRLYNLFTGANKSSYIDTFIDRSVNSFQFVDQLRGALDSKSTNWFLN
jgi:hypothetical protein